MSTGILQIDASIGGGFKEGKTYLLSGESGTGKTIFGLQYILEGVKIGEPGIFVSIDQTTKDIVEDAQSLGWDLKPYIDENLLILLDITPRFSSMYDEKNRRGILFRQEKTPVIPSIIGNLAKHISEIDAKRLVLDPIAPLISQVEEQIDIRKYIRSLIFAIDDNLGVTTLCTSEIPTGTNKLSWYGVEEYIVSGVIVLGMERAGDRYTRIISVRKMRGSPIDLSIYTYDIQAKKGIVVTPITSLKMGEFKTSLGP